MIEIYKLRDWIPKKYLKNYSLAYNPNQHLLYPQYKEHINWTNLCLNEQAIPILLENQDKINWTYLSENPSSLPIYELYPDKFSILF
jgi:hypothetical protein